MSGPLLAGKMLALGTGTVGVMAASAPGILLAGVAVFWLMHRQQRRPWSDDGPAVWKNAGPPPCLSADLAYGKTSFPDAYRPYGLHLPLAQRYPWHPPRLSRCPRNRRLSLCRNGPGEAGAWQ
jgi:hypothetical protein